MAVTPVTALSETCLGENQPAAHALSWVSSTNILFIATKSFDCIMGVCVRCKGYVVLFTQFTHI